MTVRRREATPPRQAGECATGVKLRLPRAAGAAPTFAAAEAPASCVNGISSSQPKRRRDEESMPSGVRTLSPSTPGPPVAGLSWFREAKAEGLANMASE